MIEERLAEIIYLAGFTLYLLAGFGLGFAVLYRMAGWW